jgi:hypothetical protein
MKELQFKLNSKPTESVYTSIFQSNNNVSKMTEEFGENGLSRIKTQSSVVIDRSGLDKTDDYILSQSYKFPTGVQNVNKINF